MDYTSENIKLDILGNGDWNLWLDNVLYVFQWMGDILKVSGGDVCYYLLEMNSILYQSDCSLQELSILISGI